MGTSDGSLDRRASTPSERARLYLAAQAAAGLGWWIAVFASDEIRNATLGRWDPAFFVVPDLMFFVAGSAIAAFRGSALWASVVASWTLLVTIVLVVVALLDREAGWGALAMSLATIGSVASALTLWHGYLPTAWFFVGPFTFREAEQRSPTAHLMRSLAQLVVFWSAFLVLVPVVLEWSEERLRLDAAWLDSSQVGTAGLVVGIVGSLFGFSSCIAMALLGRGTPLPAETATELVISGPYRIVRNPMAVAGAAQTIGVGLWLGSWLVVGSALAGAVVWHTWIRPEEEADLAARFGDGYDVYRARVCCWVPCVRTP